MFTKKRKRNVIPTALATLLQSEVSAKGSKFVKKELGRKRRNRGKRNPESSEEAAQLSEKWHGRKPLTHTDVEEVETYEENLAELGELEELGVLGADMTKRFVISFSKNRPKLCASDDKNLEIIDGDQTLDIEEGIIEKDGKKLVPLGYCYSIVYETDKHHLEGSNGYPESYEHFFAEEFYKEYVDPDDFLTDEGLPDSVAWFTACIEEGLVDEAVEEGRLPLLVYNKTDEKLILVGGNYSVEDVGVKD